MSEYCNNDEKQCEWLIWLYSKNCKQFAVCRKYRAILKKDSEQGDKYFYAIKKHSCSETEKLKDNEYYRNNKGV